MKDKFDPKVFKGKNRIYTEVPKAPRIYRLWVWDEGVREYCVPSRANTHYAARYEVAPNGVKKRVHASFKSLDEAREWQAGGESMGAQEISAPKPDSDLGPIFRDILNEWKRRRFMHIAYSTQVQYDKVLRLHFNSLLDCPIRNITPQRVDAWLDELKDGAKLSKKKLTRISFRHEISLLSTILKYYRDYYDDSGFQFPIKQRHMDAIRLSRPKMDTPKDLSETEFLKFREELRQCRNGNLLGVLATVQYFQALRISEAAGLYWEDIRLDSETPWNSRLKIVRSVCYPHRGNEEAFIKGGFKNAVVNKGVKEQPMFPEVFEALKTLHTEGASGMIFSLDGKPFPYRIIQCHFDRSFKRAELPYRGTHVMRHGGCRRVFNEVAELPIAQQLLGNSDLKTTLVYAKRQASALTKVVHGYWERKSKVIASDCNQPSKAKNHHSLIANDCNSGSVESN